MRRWRIVRAMQGEDLRRWWRRAADRARSPQQTDGAGGLAPRLSGRGQTESQDRSAAGISRRQALGVHGSLERQRRDLHQGADPRAAAG